MLWFTATENGAEEIEFRSTKTLMGGNNCATVTFYEKELNADSKLFCNDRFNNSRIFERVIS